MAIKKTATTPTDNRSACASGSLEVNRKTRRQWRWFNLKSENRVRGRILILRKGTLVAGTGFLNSHALLYSVTNTEAKVILFWKLSREPLLLGRSLAMPRRLWLCANKKATLWKSACQNLAPNQSSFNPAWLLSWFDL